MLPAWSTALFKQRAVRVVELRDVTVAADGLVFSRDGDLYRETITQHSRHEIAAASTSIEQHSGGIERLRGPHVLCVKRGAANYGHWLMEMLPKAGLMKGARPDQAFKYVVPKQTGAMGRSIRDSLRLLGIGHAETVPLGSQPLAFERLVVVDGLTEHGCYMSPLVVQGCRRLAPRIQDRPGSKIYVSRRSAGSRRVVNEDDVVSRAIQQGYVPIDPGTLSFEEQRRVFSNATHVVGIMGAGATNIVFCRPGADIRLLAPAVMPDTFFWFIAGLAGHRYTEVRCPSLLPPEGSIAWSGDIEVRREDLEYLFH